LIPKTGPGNEGKREKLLDVLRHLSKHVEHMRYNVLRKSDRDIATCALEGAVCNLVRMRLGSSTKDASLRVRLSMPSSVADNHVQPVDLP
jgi:hypothetical protein